MTLVEYASRAELMAGLAAVIADQLSAGLLSGPVSLSVPGGTTPGPVFDALAAMDLVWIPSAPLWLVRVVAGIEGLAALGLILPGLVRLPMGIVTVSALVLLVVQLAALGLDLVGVGMGDLPVKAVVLALTLFILWVRLRTQKAEATAP